MKTYQLLFIFFIFIVFLCNFNKENYENIHEKNEVLSDEQDDGSPATKEQSPSPPP